MNNILDNEVVINTFNAMDKKNISDVLGLVNRSTSFIQRQLENAISREDYELCRILQSELDRRKQNEKESN